MKIFVVGSLNMDLTITAPVMPAKGMTVEGRGFFTTPGGKGANQAVACSKLGAKTYMVGAVGKAFGGELISSLEACGADTRFVRRFDDVSSGIAVIVVENGDNRIILDKGANAKTDFSLVDEALTEAEEGDYLVVQLEIEEKVVSYALRRAKEKGLITVLNPAPAKALDDGVFACTDYFTPNQTETKFYTGIYPATASEASEAALILKEKGVKNVIITMGSEGSLYADGEKSLRAGIFPVKAIDTTAAGDTYVGALVVKLSEGASVKEAMRFASAASAVTVTRRGAQIAIPTRKEAEEMLLSGENK